MSIGTILGILFFLIAAICVFTTITMLTKRKSGVAKVCGAFAVIFVLLLVLIPESFHTVESGQVAVVKHLGEARNIRNAGTYFDFWITESRFVQYLSHFSR